MENFFDFATFPVLLLLLAFFMSNCTCIITHLQEGRNVPDRDGIYTVEVDCREHGLEYFPKLPEHARSVYLAHYRVSLGQSQRAKVVHSLTLSSKSMENFSLPQLFLYCCC